MLLSRRGMGTHPEMSSHTTFQGTFSNSHPSLLSHCGLILSERVESVCMNKYPLKERKKSAGTE